MRIRTSRFLFACAGSAAGLAFLLLPCWAGRLNPDAYAGGRSRDAEARAVRNTSSAAVMLGEMRTALSDIMFIKSERYMHSGVACKPHLQREILSVSGAMAHDAPHHEPHHGEDGDPAGEKHEAHVHDARCTHEQHQCEVLIKPAEDDFRGFIGNLERPVKPYFAPGAPHHHTDGLELLPWFRVMTVSDPHYIPGYTTGAWWLNRRRPEEALAFIEEGVRNNPDSFQIRFTQGQILLTQARAVSPDLFAPEAAGRPLALRARDVFAQAGALAMAQWQRQAEQDATAWTDYLIEDALACARMHVLMEWKFGDAARAGELAGRYLEIVGGDPGLTGIARQILAG